MPVGRFTLILKKIQHMNWFILIPVGVVLIALVTFLVMRNVKDEKKFEQHLNNDYHKSKEEEGDVDIEEITK